MGSNSQFAARICVFVSIVGLLVFIGMSGGHKDAFDSNYVPGATYYKVFEASESLHFIAATLVIFLLVFVATSWFVIDAIDRVEDRIRLLDRRTNGEYPVITVQKPAPAAESSPEPLKPQVASDGKGWVIHGED